MPVPCDHDAELMLRVRQGDREAFACLVDKYKLPVTHLIYRMVRDATEAEDLAQAVFIQAYKSAERYTVTAKFSTWLFTIARNLSLNELRRRGRHPTLSLQAEIETDDRSFQAGWLDPNQSPPGDEVLRLELESKVEEAIQQLPEKQRTALLLCREEELSYEDIAKVLNCSLSATKSLIFRARETLKLCLKPYLSKGLWEKTG